MSDARTEFYKRCIRDDMNDTGARVLICGAGNFDKSVFESMGFKDVTISNLDTRMEGTHYSPYRWSYEDAEKLSFSDNAFDYVVIHAAIHHASSPHRVLTEMYRVAGKGVLAIESRDSFVMKIFERFGLTQVYEHAAVFYNNGKFGGVNNSEIPNFVYRWTEREIEKTIKSYAPYARHEFRYHYGTSFPVSPELEKNGAIRYAVLKTMQPFFWIFTRLFPRQQNLFGFFIKKPQLPAGLWEWIKWNNDSHTPGFNQTWANQIYKEKKPG